MLLCVFIMEGVVTLISFETDNISVQRIFRILPTHFNDSNVCNHVSAVYKQYVKKYFQDTSDLLLKQIDTQLRHYKALDDMKKNFILSDTITLIICNVYQL